MSTLCATRWPHGFRVWPTTASPPCAPLNGGSACLLTLPCACIATVHSLLSLTHPRQSPAGVASAANKKDVTHVEMTYCPVSPTSTHSGHTLLPHTFMAMLVFRHCISVDCDGCMPHTRTLSEVFFGGGGTSGCAPSASCSAGGLASYSYAGGFAPDILLSGWVAEVVYSVVVGGVSFPQLSASSPS
jgi:hypothetical protein